MKITACVTCYNSEHIVKICIDSLLTQTRPFDEIIIIDNASTDKTPGVLKQYNNVTFLKEKVNKSDCRNMAWRQASSDVVAIIENDSYYAPDWCEKVMQCFESGAVAVNDRRAVYNPKSLISKVTDNFMYARTFVNRNKYKPFAGWVFKKELLEKIGGYDGISGIEDLDLGKRLMNAGYEITYQHEAIEYHDGEPRTLIHEIKRSWWFGKEMTKFYKKWGYDEKELCNGILFMLGMSMLILYPVLFVLVLISLVILLTIKFYSMGMSGFYSIMESMLSIVRKWFYTLSLFVNG